MGLAVSKRKGRLRHGNQQVGNDAQVREQRTPRQAKAGDRGGEGGAGRAPISGLGPLRPP